ncbi:PREDICTED: CRIB domain-containing protein RIC4-like [Ipomoea nil]|uniref:CRIB domain-containing protein RIC4-like n=1 Tax=Ipomoea nil TaxID=35883 RepID=UPI0009015CA7|nr:PREDICTED: CRIB domain-containing protein RIC4-like [Ipomoea nil]
MRDRMERFALLPFSMGCVSESSVAVARPLHLTNTPPNNPLHTPKQKWREEGEEEEEEEEREEGDEKTRHPKLRRILKNFKNLSQLFLYKEDGDEVGEEESRMMEIGHPTDVKHVTHIGMDGASTSILSQSWTPSCRIMMDMHHHHHHHDIFFSTTTSPSPTTAATTPATNPPSPASIAMAVHHQPADV